MDRSEAKKLVLWTTEEHVVQTCQTAMGVVSDAIPSLQTVALDVRDVVAEIERVLDVVRAEGQNPSQTEMLYLALEQGKALVSQLHTIGAYDPVPIELL